MPTELTANRAPTAVFAAAISRIESGAESGSGGRKSRHVQHLAQAMNRTSYLNLFPVEEVTKVTSSDYCTDAG